MHRFSGGEGSDKGKLGGGWKHNSGVPQVFAGRDYFGNRKDVHAYKRSFSPFRINLFMRFGFSDFDFIKIPWRCIPEVLHPLPTYPPANSTDSRAGGVSFLASRFRNDVPIFFFFFTHFPGKKSLMSTTDHRGGFRDNTRTSGDRIRINTSEAIARKRRVIGAPEKKTKKQKTNFQIRNHVQTSSYITYTILKSPNLPNPVEHGRYPQRIYTIVPLVVKISESEF